MNYTVQELACKYADMLVVFHTVQRLGDPQDIARAYDDLMLAQGMLKSAAIRAAEMNLKD